MYKAITIAVIALILGIVAGCFFADRMTAHKCAVYGNVIMLDGTHIDCSLEKEWLINKYQLG